MKIFQPSIIMDNTAVTESAKKPSVQIFSTWLMLGRGLSRLIQIDMVAEVRWKLNILKIFENHKIYIRIGKNAQNREKTDLSNANESKWATKISWKGL